MRALALIGLVLALLVVGVLAKKQLAATNAIVVPAAVPEGPVLQGGSGSARAQSQQIQQQYKQALDAAMQPRAMPDEAR